MRRSGVPVVSALSLASAVLAVLDVEFLQGAMVDVLVPFALFPPVLATAIEVCQLGRMVFWVVVGIAYVVTLSVACIVWATMVSTFREPERDRLFGYSVAAITLQGIIGGYACYTRSKNIPSPSAGEKGVSRLFLDRGAPEPHFAVAAQFAEADDRPPPHVDDEGETVFEIGI